MLNKIDPQLLSHVTTTGSSQSNQLECIVYANNYGATLQYLNKHFAAQMVTRYPFMLAFGIKANFEALNQLAGLDAVSYIAGNSKVSTMVNVSKQVLHLELNDHKLSRQPISTVAIIDTGIDPVLDIFLPQKRLVHFEDFVNHKTTPYDDNGHGTFVTSVLAGNGFVSGGKFAGIHPNAHVISLKALDEKGETGAMTILEAMQWVYDNRKKFNIKVVCMSFGSGTIGKRDPLIIGAEVLWNAGVCVVSAAGNSGPNEETIKSPGASSKIITVGALDDGREAGNSQLEVAQFSSRGPVFGNFKPDLLAPGVNITSACNYNLFHNHYKKMSGTSVATPMVAGVCSLLCSSNLLLSPNEMKRLLLKNCDPLTYDKNAEGFGLLNCSFLKNVKII